MSQMKVVRCPKYGPPEILKIDQAPIPQPKADEVLLKVHASTVTVADTRVRAFRVPASFWIPARLILGIFRPKNDILGAEVAGTVVAVGNQVRNYQTGDTLIAALPPRLGGYAEYTCISAKFPTCPMPTNISFAEAAALPIGAATALNYLRKIEPTPQHQLLIYGASGSVGTYAVQMAAQMGFEVTAVCSGKNLDLVRSLGAATALDYTQADFEQRLGLYDSILIAIDKLPFSICNKHLKKEGTYLNIVKPIKPLAMLLSQIGSKRKFHMAEDAKDQEALLKDVADMVSDGKLKVVIDRSYPLDEIVAAHRYVDEGHKVGNVCIEVLQKEAKSVQ